MVAPSRRGVGCTHQARILRQLMSYLFCCSPVGEQSGLSEPHTGGPPPRRARELSPIVLVWGKKAFLRLWSPDNIKKHCHAAGRYALQSSPAFSFQASHQRPSHNLRNVQLPGKTGRGGGGGGSVSAWVSSLCLWAPIRFLSDRLTPTEMKA